MTFKLAPSILAADFSRLGDQIRAAENAGADLIHIDVMDGQFVPNITIGPLIVEACRRVTTLPLDVHLMIVNPERYIPDFATAGANNITIHAEATPHIHRALQQIHTHDINAGLTINPLTPLIYFKEALPDIQRALIMSVNPGFGGQSLIPSSLERLRQLRTWRDELNPACDIQVDGGVNASTIRAVLDAGADVVVAGSAVFKGEDISSNIQALRNAANT